MKIISLGRGQGKTLRLIYASEFQNIPILCVNVEHKQYVISMARKLGINIPEPLAISDLVNLQGKCTSEDYLVDEGLYALKMLVSHITNGRMTNIVGVTLSEEE